MTNSEKTRRVTVGDRELEIPPFRGMKALRTGAILQRLANDVPQIMDDYAEYERDYKMKHTLRVTPELAEANGWPVAPEQFGDEGYFDLVIEPSREQMAARIFAKGFELAEQEGIRLLALIAIPNSELRRADEADELDAALDKFGHDLLYEGDLAELTELVVVAYEMIGAQFVGKQALGKLRATVMREFEARLPSKSTTKSNSSTDSQASTDGPAAKSSSKSRGRTSRATSSA